MTFLNKISNLDLQSGSCQNLFLVHPHRRLIHIPQLLAPIHNAENEEYKINNTINDASLLYCYKKSDLVLWECLDCSDQSKNKIMVCFPCTKRCHENHKFEVRGLKDYNLDGKCQCTSYHK